MNVILVGLALAVGAPATKEAPKKDSPTLVGEWVPTQAIRDGKPDTPPPGTSITFLADGKVKIKEGKRDKVEETTYKIDAKKSPAQIEIMPPSGETGPTIVGIYQFEKDKLILCMSMGGERPKAFESPAGARLMLITLERKKKE